MSIITIHIVSQFSIINWLQFLMQQQQLFSSQQLLLHFVNFNLVWQFSFCSLLFFNQRIHCQCWQRLWWV